MSYSKCDGCHRGDVCALRHLVELTLPWVAEAGLLGKSEWERAQAVGRALRGSGASPGFVEDWILAGAMAPGDVEALVEEITRLGRVDAEILCRPCRHYVGPALASASAAAPAP